MRACHVSFLVQFWGTTKIDRSQTIGRLYEEETQPPALSMPPEKPDVYLPCVGGAFSNFGNQIQRLK